MNTPEKIELYDFGAGLVPAHRHPNGRGWVANTAKVDASAYVGLGALWVFVEQLAASRQEKP